MFTAEYSLKQKCFHIQDLEKTLEGNIATILSKNSHCDYIVFAIGKTFKDASVACKIMREGMKNVR